jgi:hypothetical protein
MPGSGAARVIMAIVAILVILGLVASLVVAPGPAF